MKMALRLAVAVFGFLAIVSAADAQFEKLQPANYGVWSPHVGSGAVYQLESQGRTQIYEVTVVGAQRFGDAGSWLEIRITTSGTHGVSTQQFVSVSGKKLATKFQIIAPLEGGLGVVLSDSTPTSPRRISVTGAGSLDGAPKDFRKQATQIGTENISTPAGTFESEVWRMKKDGAVVWYSPRVSPFGLVKLESKDGSVLLSGVITDAKFRMLPFPVGTHTVDKTADTKALYGVFTGVWAPVVGFGARYQLTRQGSVQDVEVAVIGIESKGSETFHRLEINAPCAVYGQSATTTIAGSRRTPYEYIPPDEAYTPEPDITVNNYSNARSSASCTNGILIAGTGSVDSSPEAFYMEYTGYPVDSSFSIPVMLATGRPASTRTDGPSMLVDVRTSPQAASATKQPDNALPDFRQRATLVGKENVSTPAGAFECEHWRSTDGETDVWLNSSVAPFGVVRKSSADEVLVLTQVLTSPPPRPKVKMRLPRHFDSVELRPHK